MTWATQGDFVNGCLRGVLDLPIVVWIQVGSEILENNLKLITHVTVGVDLIFSGWRRLPILQSTRSRCIHKAIGRQPACSPEIVQTSETFSEIPSQYAPSRVYKIRNSVFQEPPPPSPGSLEIRHA